MTRSGGEVLLDALIAHGVHTAFCVPGESYLGALDAMHDHEGEFRLITCRQEGGAAYMADAWGKLGTGPGVCFVSRGPGASNAMVGLHTAFQDSTPVLCFVGQISRVDRGREAFQELDYGSVFGGVVKRVVVIDDAGRIEEQLHQAWSLATRGRPGPVMVVLYEDMLEDPVIGEPINPQPQSLRHFDSGPRPEALSLAARWLADAQQPLVIVGDSDWECRCAERITGLAERLQFPVATAFRRQDSIDNTHPHYVGELGLVAPSALDDYLAECDLLLVVGPRLGDITTRSYSLLEPGKHQKRRRLIHVHSSADELNQVYPADLAIVCSSEAFLEGLGIQQSEAPDRAKVITPLRAAYQAFVEAPRDTQDPLRMDQVMATLRKRLPPESIICNGAGNYTTWPQRHYQFRLARTQLAPTNGSMGYGVPAAVAAKLMRPEVPVISFSGDGCFLMNGQELATAVQYSLGIVFLIINNQRYGTIRAHQERHYPGRVVGTDLNNPDFVALAQAYGARGFLVAETDQFADAFEQAMAVSTSEGRPCVIELRQSG